MSRPVYTAEQIFRVYERVGLPQKWRLELDEAKKISRSQQGLEFLSILLRCTLCSVPFENLELHYSRTKTIDIDPGVLYDKIVAQNNGRGGYCMENNSFFGTVLRTLGFRVMSTGGRVNSAVQPNGDQGERAMFFGFGHMINIVTIENARYMVDVGFGAGCATSPLPLEDGKIHVNIRPNQSVRLRYDTIPESESEAKVWIYERRISEDQDFRPCYCFPDNVEFLPADYITMNHFTSTSRMVFFTYMIIVVKMIMSEDGKEIVGEFVVMGNQAQRRILGKKENLGVCESEARRVELLEKHIGLKLTERQRSGILGTASMIR